MKKKFKIEVDCANCAVKIEDAIKKIPGVNDAVVSFMTGKITIDADDTQFDSILKQAQKTCMKIDSESRIIV